MLCCVELHDIYIRSELGYKATKEANWRNRAVRLAWSQEATRIYKLNTIRVYDTHKL